MKNSIYDILGKRLNIIREYEKLYEMFVYDQVYLYNRMRYSLAEIFDEFIDGWDYRSTYRNIDEIMEELELDDTTTEDTGFRDILYLMELILNVNEYIKEKVSVDDFNFARPGMLCLIDKKNIMLKNIDIILKKLGYVPSKINKNQIRLRKNNVDALETVMIINNESISQMILDYIDFRIEHDINAKKDILNNLGHYIEPLRKKIKEANSSLEDNIFYFLNKLNIRHNNISGKAKIDYVANMSEEKMINWYDKIYNLILIAIRLIEMPKTFKELKKLKVQIINDEFKTESRKE